MTYPRKYQQCDTRDGSRYRVEEAAAIIKLQLNFEAKQKLSDVILDNSDDTNQWIYKIKELI